MADGEMKARRRMAGPSAGALIGWRVGLVVVGVVVVGVIGVTLVGPARVYWILTSGMGRKHWTVAERVGQVGPRVGPIWGERLATAGLGQPKGLILVGLKAEQRLHVLAEGDDGRVVGLAVYPWTAMSGGPGPKLREGDRQIPEGFYAIESLHANSRFHLALRVAYPSAEDREVARAQGRGGLGGDIMIHGGDRSIGCIAIGDPGIEEVFWLSAQIGVENIRLLIAPSGSPAEAIRADTPAWVAERYRKLAEELARLQVPG